MLKKFTLEYWKDDKWYVGKLKEVSGVFSQGKSLVELEENIRDAYYLMKNDSTTLQIKPEIPLTGNDGIPIRDEIELVFLL